MQELLFNIVAKVYNYQRKRHSKLWVKHQLAHIDEKSYVFSDCNLEERKEESCENCKVIQEIKYDRVLSVGFDDIRLSDLMWLAPLFNKFGYSTTFNKIVYGHETKYEVKSIKYLLKHGHEIGCHTLLHEQYPYFSPLYNGYDPNKPDGSNQTPFPTNDELRKDIGGGYNCFGKKLTDKTNLGSMGLSLDGAAWGNLTDEQCQKIRDHFSVFKNREMLATLDVLSKKYLGTYGSSRNSWSKEKKCYTQGIFTGCSTSENHEIWERVFKIQQCLLRELKVGTEIFETWSLPGGKYSPLLYEKEGVLYYDREKSKPFNCLACFKSSLTGGNRSITDVLRSFGYTNTHDTNFVGRRDGLPLTEQRNQFYFNAYLSKKDGLANCTTKTILHRHRWESEGLNHFDSEPEAYKTDKINDNGIYASLENLRHALANGIMAGCIWDTTFEASEKRYWEMILRYCKETGVSVIPKKEAYKVAFSQKRDKGNLIYNPKFSNTLINYLPNNDVPSNPDGWMGDCNTSIEDGHNVLSIHGEVRNRNYGLPYGHLKYSVEAKGNGEIYYGFIRNNTPLGKRVMGGVIL